MSSLEHVSNNASDQNVTETDPVDDRYASGQWTFLQCASSVLTVLQVSVFVYMTASRKDGFAQRDNQPRRASLIEMRHPAVECGSFCTKGRAAWLRRLTILAGASALLKAFSNQIDLFFGARSDVDCQVFGCAAVIGYGGSLCFIYVVLWLRQDQLQQLAVLRHLPGRRFRLLLSRVLLIAMLFAFFVLFILNFVTLSVDASAQGCVFTDIGKVSQSVRSTAGLLFTGLFHPAFAALLTYPLIKSNSAVTEAMKGSESANRKTERTRKLIKRVLATLLVVAATDAATIAASYWMETFPAIRIALVYDLNALVGVASLLFSFSDWRKRLRFCRLRHQQTDQTASMSSA